jgi:hypothetical protein
MQSDAKTVDAYFSTLVEKDAQTLQPLRDILTRYYANQESMTYGMPTYGTGKETPFAFNAQKNYYSLYIDPQLLDPYREHFAHLKPGKSCIRFKRLEQLPLEIVETIIKGSANSAEEP